MTAIKINQEKLTAKGAEALANICPFDAIEIIGGVMTITEGCRLCKQCLKADKDGALSLDASGVPSVWAEGEWAGISLFAEFLSGELHPVTMELLGKALELSAGRVPVTAILPGYGAAKAGEALARMGAETVFLYDHPSLEHFDAVRFTACAEDCIQKTKPAVVLFGATPAGRSLAPRVAARLHTGLTADCTSLELRGCSELVQVRPAFGGNVMAQILTKQARPQMCTVRHRMFDPPREEAARCGTVTLMPVPDAQGGTRILSVSAASAEKDLSEADVIVAVGRGCSDRKLIDQAKRLAELLGAQLGCTRPMIESGLFDAKKQIGLSGRTVKPSLFVALGISGSVQFAAGMEQAELILAVNSDPGAPIFSLAHLGLCGDVAQVLPAMIERLEGERK